MPELVAARFPEIAAKLDWPTLQLVDSETFTDFPAGSRRTVDRLGLIRTVTGEEEWLLIHVEVQADPRSDFPARMYPSRRMLLAAFLGNYISLSKAEQIALEQEVRLTPSEPAKEVEMLLTSWHKRGREEGRAEARAEGVVEGEAKGIKGALTRVLENRFGTLSSRTYQQIGDLDDPETLDALLDLVLSGASLRQLEDRLEQIGSSD